MIERIIIMLEKYWQQFLRATGITLMLAIITVILGTIIGIILAMGKLSNNKSLKILSNAYVEIIRGTPLLLQIIVIYTLFASSIGKMNSVIIALFINSSAYVSEIVRAGIQAVDIGQTEAARSLGLNSKQTMLKIVLPQAVKNILPALGNEFVTVIKETSLASWYYLGDLMTIQKEITGSTNLIIEPYIIIGVIYLCLTYGISRLIKLFEKRMATND